MIFDRSIKNKKRKLENLLIPTRGIFSSRAPYVEQMKILHEVFDYIDRINYMK